MTPVLFEQTFSTRYGIDGHPVLSQFFEAERVPTSRFPGTAEFLYKFRSYNEADFTDRWVDPVGPGDEGHWAVWAERIMGKD